MELRKFEIEGKEIEFVNESRGTRSGFAHDTTLFVDGYRVAEHTCHYLNRTWESYTYQTVMKCAVSDKIERLTDYLKYRFMEAKGYKKLTAIRRAEFEEACKVDPDIKFYRAVYAKL